MKKHRKLLFRLALIVLILIVLSEITLIAVNSQNLAGYEVPIFADVNSTSNYLLLVLMARNAFIKISIVITNPSNTSIAIYLPNETTMILNPGDSAELTNLFPPSAYFAYSCEEYTTLLGVNGTVTIGYTYISGKTNPVIIRYVYTPTYVHDVQDIIKSLSCARGYYIIISTSNGKPASFIIDIKYVVMLV
ncbi:hypothetical protein [Vulcanisaeta moutnovskia]|uniref:hypothetical protein n=1 Tax=Vulcanisaeta moutnovskia TaxID=985052 RepID=UPI00064F174B|nr:hypothetical protein [Vulcanisaeta moutnovskia]